MPGRAAGARSVRHVVQHRDRRVPKQVRALGSAGEAVAYTLNPLPKQLGQKYKNQYPAIRQALLALDPETTAQALLSGKSVPVDVDGERYEVLPEEVEVRAEALAGFVVASEGSYLAALKTDQTPDLVKEGLAREFVRRVQDQRKQAGFEIADRIRLYALASAQLAQALDAHQVYVMGETLALEFKQAAPPEGASMAEFEFDGERVKIGLEKYG